MEGHKKMSDVGIVLIQTLIERKEKEKQAEKRLYLWSIISIVCLILGCGYFLLYINRAFEFLSFLLNNQFFLLICCMFAISLLQVNLAKKKLDKAEEEYDSLRYEIIERAEEIWNTEELWKERDLLYDELKKKFDVNLYHK